MDITQHSDPAVEAMRVSTRALRRAEGEQLLAVVSYADRVEQDIASRDTTALDRELARRAVHLAVGEALGIADRAAATILHQARTARRRLPRTWRGLLDGRIDSRTLRRTVEAAEQLTDPRSVEALDAWLVDAAESRRAAQIDARLRRFVASQEPHHQAVRAKCPGGASGVGSALRRRHQRTRRRAAHSDR